MDAKELRKKLEEGLKPDTSGKTTPIQRLTPFLHALIEHLEDRDAMIEEFSGLELYRPTPVSSDDATQVATAQTNSESDGATKPEAHQPKAQHRDVQQALGTAPEPLPANRSAGE